MTIEDAIKTALVLYEPVGVTEATILGRTRGDSWTCEARAVVMRILYDADWTAARIGLYLHRHRSTVLHALGLRGGK